MKQNLIKLFVLFVFISCNNGGSTKNELSNDIIECVKYNSNRTSAGTIKNIYNHIEKLEKYLIKEKHLDKIDKDSYKKLLLDVNQLVEKNIRNEKYSKIYQEISDNDSYSDWISSAGIFHVPFDCITRALKGNNLDKEDYYYYFYNSNLELMIGLNKYFDKGSILDLIETTPDDKFDNIIYRAPLITIFYLNLKSYVRVIK